MKTSMKICRDSLTMRHLAGYENGTTTPGEETRTNAATSKSR